MTDADRFASWVRLLVLGTLGGMFLGGLLQARNTPQTVTVTVTDTVYAPPPGFSELFNLECRWVPDADAR
jgi:hypothetical protein